MSGAGLSLPGWAARFAATHSGFPGYVAVEGGRVWQDWFGVLPPIASASATAALALGETAQGTVPVAGSAQAGLQVDATAVGWALPQGAASLAVGFTPLAVGQALSLAEGSAQAGLQVDATAVGWALPQGTASLAVSVTPLAVGAMLPVGAVLVPGAVLALSGPQPLEIQGRAIHGYHRPLGGEVASLTLIVADPNQLFPDWLQAPPLGSACRVDYDGAPIMTGYLYAVRATAAGLELRIEG